VFVPFGVAQDGRIVTLAVGTAGVGQICSILKLDEATVVQVRFSDVTV
jgi:hypothetical protein